MPCPTRFPLRRLRRGAPCGDAFEDAPRETGKSKWTATRVDLVFGANSIFRALAEVYACSDAPEKLVHDFVAAWDMVTSLDWFDVKG